MFPIIAREGKQIPLGVQGEDKARCVIFPFADMWMKQFPSPGTFEVVYEPPEGDPYPCNVYVKDGEAVVWIITGTETAKDGEGYVELHYIGDDYHSKHYRWSTCVAKTLSPIGDAPPEWKSFVDDLLAASVAATTSANEAKNSADEAMQSKNDAEIARDDAETAQNIAEQAKEAATAAQNAAEEASEHYPYIGSNGNWFEWSVEDSSFVDTGHPSRGYAPQRGIDYWTITDKQEIVNEAVELIDVDGAIATHNTSALSHQDIRSEITEIATEKIDKSVMQSSPVIIGIEIVPSSVGVTITHNAKNIVTGATSSGQNSMPIADGTQVGMMTPEQVEKIEDLESRVGGLEGQNVRLSYTASDSPTAAQIRQFVVDSGYTDITKWASISVVVRTTNHIWRYYANTQLWEDIGLDTVQQASLTVKGIVQGSSTDGKVFVEADGTMSMNGYDALVDGVSNLADNKADKDDVPTELSQLSADSAHRLVSDAEKTTWNNKQDALSYSIARDAGGIFIDI